MPSNNFVDPSKTNLFGKFMQKLWFNQVNEFGQINKYL